MSDPPPPPLGSGPEFDVIRRILENSAAPGAGVALGPGDDCALIQTGDGYLAVSVDISVEGVHYLDAWGTPGMAGERAVRAALSDIAAMAAQPLAVLASISVPREDAAETAEALGSGCRRAAEEFGAQLVGGDLSRGGSEFIVDVSVLGTVSDPLLRSGARPGDELWVTGHLGAASAAVRAWIAGDQVRGEWRERFWRPTPRLREAHWLAEHQASAAIDLSDGLIADAGHLAAASGVAIEIDAAAVPGAPDVEEELALGGGEDYELLVAAPGGIFDGQTLSEFREAFGIPLTRVGRAVVGLGVRVFRDGVEVQIDSIGFDHFDRN